MRILDRIESIMKHDGNPSPAWLEKALLIVSKVYGLGVRLRTAAYDKGIFKTRHLPCVVVSVGNVTLGGSGKTPLTIHIAKTLGLLGYRVAVISRGYGGSAEKTGSIVSDGTQVLVPAEVSGDEPFMMAAQLNETPILVGANRYRSGLLAVRRFNPDVILLDDGFQHRRLARDLDLVLVDAHRPGGNLYLFPRGVLREPLAALNRGHAMVLTRMQSDENRWDKRLGSYLDSMPVFASQHRPKIVKSYTAAELSNGREDKRASSRNLENLNGKRALAFSGIATNENFFGALKDAGCLLMHTISFRDHHHYSRSDLAHIRKIADKLQVDCVLTTEKDYYRLSKRIDWNLPLTVVGVDIVFPDTAFDDFLTDKVAILLKKKGTPRISPNGS